MSNDDNFEPYWLDEDDWLVTVCPLPKDEDDPEVNLETLNWIGRLFGFATATNTRVLALVGDPELPAPGISTGRHPGLEGIFVPFVEDTSLCIGRH